jgi:hypothetical protein
MKGSIKYLSASEAWEFLKPRHYAGRKPQISKAFGWKIKDEIVAVCTFGKPASNALCKGICGEEHSSQVYELNRLCRVEELQEPLSQFVSACLRRLSVENWIIVSYSDTGMHHNGYIYQACNFLYTGQTKQRTDMWNGKGHSRHADKSNESKQYRVVRTAKNRYVFFATKNKYLKKKWLESLNYSILPYPKEENQNYTLGVYQKPILVLQQKSLDSEQNGVKI